MRGFVVCSALFFLVLGCKAENTGQAGKKQQEMKAESTKAGEKGGAIKRILNASSTAEERVRMAMEHKDVMLDLTGKETATIKTNKGDFEVEFYKDAAPLTVNNFIKLAELGFYDGLIFHRYEPNFVIQGGDPQGTGYGDAGYTIPLEVDKSVKHIKGALGMARSQDPNSGSCQFYITLKETPHLDMNYTVFGRVTSGMDVVMSLRKGDRIERIDIHRN